MQCYLNRSEISMRKKTTTVALVYKKEKSVRMHQGFTLLYVNYFSVFEIKHTSNLLCMPYLILDKMDLKYYICKSPILYYCAESGKARPFVLV